LGETLEAVASKKNLDVAELAAEILKRLPNHAKGN